MVNLVTECQSQRALALILAVGCMLVASCAPPPRRGTLTPSYSSDSTLTGFSSIAFVPTLTSTTKPVTPLPTNTLLPAAGELHLAIHEGITTLNPYLAKKASEEFVASLLYDTLLEEDSRGGLHPNLAERWELTSEGSKLTCWLNPLAKWHNGQAVTAADVVFSFNLVRRNEFPGLARIAALVHRVEAINPGQVEFSLLTTRPDTVRLLGTAVRIVPADIWRDIDDPFHYANLDNPVGSGPFRLSKHVQGEQLVLCNTRMHHCSQPSIDTITLEFLRDEGKALQALKDGKLDALGWEVPPAIALDVRVYPENYKGIRVAEAPGPSTYALFFNLRNTPFDNQVLRQALAHALDAQAIVDKALLGFAEVGAPDLFPPASQWHNAKITPVAFDPQMAMTQLASAGFIDRNGDGLREAPDGSALLIPITCPDLDTALKVIELVVANWRAVGIAAKAEPVVQDRMMPTLMRAQFNVILHSVSFSEPEMAFFYFHSACGVLRDGQVSGLNYSGYANQQYDEIAEAMQQAQDSARRLELLYELQEMLAADLPQIPLYIPHVLNLYRDDRFVGWTAQPGAGLLNRTSLVNLRTQ